MTKKNKFMIRRMLAGIVPALILAVFSTSIGMAGFMYWGGPKDIIIPIIAGIIVFIIIWATIFRLYNEE